MTPINIFFAVFGALGALVGFGSLVWVISQGGNVRPSQLRDFKLKGDCLEDKNSILRFIRDVDRKVEEQYKILGQVRDDLSTISGYILQGKKEAKN